MSIPDKNQNLQTREIGIEIVIALTNYKKNVLKFLLLLEGIQISEKPYSKEVKSDNEIVHKIGWIENPDPDSRVFQLKWVLKRADAGYDTLEPFQYINHFDRNTSITTKAGLARNIRNLIWYENEDVDDLYPRCYDVNDIAELDDFLDDYKFNQAIATLHGAIDSKDLTYQVPECNMAMLKICVANDICQRRLKPIEEIIRDIVIVGNFFKNF